MAISKRSTSKTVRSAGRPTPEDVLEIENRLLEASLEEFLEYGYGRASLDRIVKRARVSKTTLYSRYASKEELFRAIVYQQINNIDPGSLLRVDSDSFNLEDGLKSYANKMLEINLQGEMLGVNRLINSESGRFPELGAASAERTRLGIERISRFIKSCAEADGIPCKAPDSVAKAFILMIRGWYTNVLLTNQQVTTAQRKQWVDEAVHILISARNDW